MANAETPHTVRAAEPAESRRPRWSPLLAYKLLASFCVLLVASVAVLARVPVGGRSTIKVDGLDPKYYFGTTHALLFHQSYDLTREFEVLKPMPSSAGGFVGINGKPGSPYAIGFSLLSIPFLATGVMLDLVRGGATDGYSGMALALYFVGIAVMAVIGMQALYRLLMLSAADLSGGRVESTPFVALGTVVAVWGGTTLGYYTFSPMAHSATFMCASLFLLFWWKQRNAESLKTWAILGMLAGLTSITRWQDAVYISIPFTYDFLGGRRNGCRSAWVRTRAVYLGVIALCLMGQFWQWHTLYGQWLLVPQGSAFMSFPPRYIFDVLFSDLHGWFVWTPLTLVGIVGLLLRARRHYALIAPLVVTVALEVAVIGSMPTNWHCMDSFGIRSLTSLAPVVGIGVMILINDARSVRRVLLVSTCSLCVAYTALFAVQYRLNLVPRQLPVGIDGLIYGKVRLVAIFLKAKGRPDVMIRQLKSGSPDVTP